MRGMMGKGAILAMCLAAMVVARPASAQITITDLGTLRGIISRALAINDSGQVVGHSRTASGQTHAALWTVFVTAIVANAQIEGIIADVGSLLGEAQGQSLIKKLDAATLALNREDTDAATNVLQAFIKTVEAFIKAEILTQADGQGLLDAANSIITDVLL